MTRGVVTVYPWESVGRVARLMDGCDLGVLPVCGIHFATNLSNFAFRVRSHVNFIAVSLELIQVYVFYENCMEGLRNRY
jgi:hypothetical protein